MNRIQRAIVLLAVQAALVLSIAGKYLYQREVCPRVWVPAAQYDPNMPLRGRYLALQLAVDACGLPWNDSRHTNNFANPGFLAPGSRDWTVKPTVRDGKLVPVLASATDRPEETQQLTLWGNRPCNRAGLSRGIDFFVPDTAKTPFPLHKGEELWVEVTVPPVGPPRPLQLALSTNGVFTPLKLD